MGSQAGAWEPVNSSRIIELCRNQSVTHQLARLPKKQAVYILNGAEVASHSGLESVLAFPFEIAVERLFSACDSTGKRVWHASCVVLVQLDSRSTRPWLETAAVLPLTRRSRRRHEILMIPGNGNQLCSAFTRFANAIAWDWTPCASRQLFKNAN